MLLFSCLLLHGFISFLDGQGYQGTKPDCRLVRCGRPEGCAIEDTFTPKGQCCPVCLPKGRGKPGRCPSVRLDELGICINECSNDYNCPGRQKCCSNGCGRVCRRPVRGGTKPDCSFVRCGRPEGCAIEDTFIPKGQCCPVCLPKGREKPGSCPSVRPDEVGICINECSNDYNCPGRQKCCSNGCGRVCRSPVRGGQSHCYGVVCPLIRCINQYTPPGRCCPECLPPFGGVDCSAVLCLRVTCKGAFTPPGQCCQVCPSSDNDGDS